MAHSNDEIRGVLVQSGSDRLLLPNATVAEVLSRAPVVAMEGMPEWLPGNIDWHGWQVPVIAFSQLSGQGSDVAPEKSKIVVLKNLDGDERLPYFALLTPSFPRLVSVPRDGLLADATEQELPVGVQVRVLLGDETAVLPDMETIHRMIQQAIAQAA
ncbi:chemotaxis protein CheW [Pseudoxanthomonas dokdonensis]|uniref:Chemotaxis protein CheW n=1 Tax=Pseudoxanthomonas dokdonensis TaxID=344882 RepID=A0A0R0CPC2_9GAMM|nr:chemotaxis protein CheW [Pseudoxanthomonas dokdonensis]KRG71461.1 chemotaxis protein CheW [Pseudoxanthomonas dokdonensis]